MNEKKEREKLDRDIEYDDRHCETCTCPNEDREVK